MLLCFWFNARIKFMKKLIKFLWEDLYNKRSIMIVNIYNIISTAWLTCLFIVMSHHKNEEGLGYFGALLITFFYNFFVYVICYIIFIIETKKKKVMKDNPVIKNGIYRVISIFSIIIAYIHYFLFNIFIACVFLGRLGF